MALSWAVDELESLLSENETDASHTAGCHSCLKLTGRMPASLPWGQVPQDVMSFHKTHQLSDALEENQEPRGTEQLDEGDACALCLLLGGC